MIGGKMEIKDSLLMPKTEFAMRGNLKELEPKIRQFWEENNIYEEILKLRKDGEPYILHDGPPYANSNIHLGTALNKIIKDMIMRTKTSHGYYSPYIPGWDTHGLPIENALQKQGVNRKEMSAAEFRNLCNAYAKEQIDIQREQFKALGVMGRWNNPYLTLNKEYEANQIKVFADMALKGLIYKGLKPVYWSPASETALAEAEIEYYDKEDVSIYVKFKVIDDLGKGIIDANFVIWTTTPWTMPANLAIALHPELTYGLYSTSQGKLIFLASLEKELTDVLNLENVKLETTFLGQELEYVITAHPMQERESLIVMADYVTAEAGTGCVHTAPGHGAEDFITGQKYHLEVLCPVDEKGYMTSEAGVYNGLFYADANKQIVEDLRASGALMADIKFNHSYPHDWRTKTPLIFRATDQWFASIKPIKEDILNAINDVKWYNSWAPLRMTNMMKDRADWCISRQRLWGVPIPIIYNEDGSPILEEKVFNHIIDIFKAEGSNAWFEKSVLELLPPGYVNPLSPNNGFKKETDVMDVWFDSGSSFKTVVNGDLQIPVANLYIEGSDQYRGWFNSSLIIGVATTGKAPYKEVLSHGFVLDGKGQKMSKSLGNVVDPNQIVSTQGADILRLWAISSDYMEDVTISDEILKQVTENYRKIRNTFRFISGNLHDFNNIEFTSTNYLDQLIINKLNVLNNNVVECFDEFNFNGGLSMLNNFINNDLSAMYLDITKDILYCDSQNSERRRQVQATYYQICDTLMRLFAPILVHTMEEFYQTSFKQSALSVHELEYKNTIIIDQVLSDRLLDEYNQLILIKNDVSKGIEEARTAGLIKSSQEVEVLINIKDQQLLDVFNKLSAAEQERFLIVSKVVLTDQTLTEYKSISLSVIKHQGEKCVRCWNYFDPDKITNQMCPRCNEVFNNLKNND